jgi:hypothetical protein
MTLAQFAEIAHRTIDGFVVVYRDAQESEGGSDWPYIQDEEAWWDSFDAGRTLNMLGSRMGEEPTDGR